MVGLGDAVALVDAGTGPADAVGDATADAEDVGMAEALADGDAVGRQSSSGEVEPVSSRFFTMRWAS